MAPDDPGGGKSAGVLDTRAHPVLPTRMHGIPRRSHSPSWRRWLVALALLAPLARPVAAAPAPKPNNVTFNPLGALVGGIACGYARGLGGHFSLGVNAVYVTPLILPAHGAGGGIEALAWTRRPHSGFFAGAFVQMSRLWPTDSLAGYSSKDLVGVLGVFPGAALGWRWLWTGGFNIGLAGGMGYGIPLESIDCPPGATCKYVGKGPQPQLRFDLGYAF